MAKIAFTKLGLKRKDEVKTVNINNNVIEAGQSIGIFTEQKEGHNGTYVAVLYNANAQNFILNNISAIIEQE